MVKLLATQRPDEEGRLLHEFMRNLKKIAYCKNCLRAYNHYASQGRTADFLRGDV